jgi:hypothetical protein
MAIQYKTYIFDTAFLAKKSVFMHLADDTQQPSIWIPSNKPFLSFSDLILFWLF